MSALTLSSDGSLTIPAALVQTLGISTGEPVNVKVSSSRKQLVVEPGTTLRPRLVRDENGHVFLEADTRSPQMTPDLIKEILSE